MKRVLMISSFVAGSNVGGTVAMKALSRLDTDVCLLPTTLLGRHPGWGAPGGGAVPDDLFRGMIEGLNANEIPQNSQVIVTGYFASADQVRQTADLIDEHRQTRVPVIVDAIMGDTGKGLYVKDDVADAIVEWLVPRASHVKCNAWEFWEIEKRRDSEAERPASPGNIEALQSVLQPLATGQAYFVSSVIKGGRVGAICADHEGGYWFGHDPVEGEFSPNGLGDYLTSLIARSLAWRDDLPANKLLSSVMGDFGPVFDYQETGAQGELNLRTLGMVADTKRFMPVEKIW